jgi:undecaprenyl-diphosphatase
MRYWEGSGTASLRRVRRGTPLSIMSIAAIRARIHVPHLAHPVLLLAFVALLGAAVTFSTAVVHLDARIAGFARGAAEVPNSAGFLVSTFGGTDFVMPFTVVAVLILCALRHWRGAAALVVAVLGTQVVVDLIKTAVERPRPALNDAVANASGASFPSAHSATSMALYATLGVLAVRHLRGPVQWIAVGGCGAVVAAVGLSRVLLSAHYPIDVLAGWMTGGAIVVGAWLLLRRLRVPALPAAARS